jgi:quercetin dioxygenase-like cupin family protein
MAEQTVVRRRGEGEAFWLLGGLYEVKASSDETGGAATIMEITLPASMGPPPHTHSGGEAVYVLEGKLRYHIGEETVEGGPGSFFHIAAGTWENFEPLEESRLLIVYMPGGVERFFAEAGEPAAARELPPAPEGPPDFEQLAAIGARYGMQMRPPAEG